MQPNDEAQNMREEADHMMQMIRGLKARKSSDFLAKDLLNWLCISFQQHAEFKLSMADVIEGISKNYPDFQMIPITTEAVYKQSQYDSKEETESINVEAPPFDASFWMGLGDL